MTFHFKLELTRIQVLNEQFQEPGKDELRLFGFGMSRKGTLFSPGFVSLGSYGSGDDRSTGIFPMTLFEADLDDDGLDVAAMFWMIEEDSGTVAAEAGKLVDKFKKAYQKQAVELNGFGFPRGCIPLTAFYRALIPFNDTIKSAARHWWNDDDVGEPKELYFRNASQNILGESGQVLATMFVSGAGIYTLFFDYSYKNAGGPGLDT